MWTRAQCSLTLSLLLITCTHVQASLEVTVKVTVSLFTCPNNKSWQGMVAGDGHGHGHGETVTVTVSVSVSVSVTVTITVNGHGHLSPTKPQST